MYDERQQRIEEAQARPGYKSNKRFKPSFINEEEKLIEQKKKELRQIENFIGETSYQVFKDGFKMYKTSPTATIDQYCKDLFHAFLGAEEPVCHLEVENYKLRKQLFTRLED